MPFEKWLDNTCSWPRLSTVQAMHDLCAATAHTYTAPLCTTCHHHILTPTMHDMHDLPVSLQLQEAVSVSHDPVTPRHALLCCSCLRTGLGVLQLLQHAFA